MSTRLWTARIALVGLLVGTVSGLRWVLELQSPVFPVLAAVFLLGCQVWNAGILLGDAVRGCPALSSLACSLVPTMLAALIAVHPGHAWLLPIIAATAAAWTGSVHQLAAHVIDGAGESDE